MKTLDAFDSGSNYSFGDKSERANVPRSLFDLSHLNTLTIDNAGELVPICLLETVPGDSFDLKVDALLRVLPLEVPLYSRQRLYVHAFYSRLSDLWNHAQTFMTKGYSGNIVYTIPVLTDDNLPASFTAVTPGDLFDYMGLPIGATRAQIIAAHISALPFMMYARIYRDYFMNKNFYIGNNKWLPDDDHDFMLNDAGLVISHPTHDATGPELGVKYYRDYPQDYFLSALPFPQRGDTPTLDFELTADTLIPVGVQGTDAFIPLAAFLYSNNAETQVSSMYNNSTLYTVESTGQALNKGALINADGITPTLFQKVLGDKALQAQINDVLAHSSITLNQLRELSAQQAILEKMAKTDGTYAEFGLTFFGRVSKSAMDYRPLYIGGSYQSIAFTEVLQTVPTAEAPLGAYAGHGISYQGNGYLGRCDCDDYGFIMIMASVMPDVYYSQGIDRMWTRSLQSDMYLPERSRLGMREILNKELYFSGVPLVDDDLFAYQSPFDELRYKPSTIHGKIADYSNLSFSPYTQARHFDSLPTYSAEFGRADDVRKDYLSAPTEVAYTAQFSFGIRAVRPLPYNPVPAQII